jgi:hypothetical protein
VLTYLEFPVYSPSITVGQSCLTRDCDALRFVFVVRKSTCTNLFTGFSLTEPRC